MTSSDKELEEQLVKVGNKLLQPPSAVDELLSLLDQVERLLSRVEQSPSKSMQMALSPSTKALVADVLLGHSDVDVKVAVASCISEITRITAPDAPYDDDRMKDVFQLIVSSFENISDQSSRSYKKRVTILETVAKVRSCVVMLDLECEELIIEMFQHFLKAIRDYHPDNIFSAMETIMTLVLEESEDISLELLYPILATVKRDNQEVLPVARRLGERVVESSAAKLWPCMMQAVKSKCLSLDDYSEVIANICEGITAVKHFDGLTSGEQPAEENKLVKASSNDAAQSHESTLAVASSDGAVRVTRESVINVCSEENHPTVDESPKPAISNGVVENINEGPSTDLQSSKKTENGQHSEQLMDTEEPSKAKSGGLDNVDMVKSESKPEQSVKRRGRKSNSLVNLTPSDSSLVDGEKEAQEAVNHSKDHTKDFPDVAPEEPSVEGTMPSETEKEAEQLVKPKAMESEAVNATSLSPTQSCSDESNLEKVGQPKKEKLSQETALSADVSKKEPEGTSDFEERPQRHSGKKAPGGAKTEGKTAAVVNTSKDDSGTTSGPKAKQPKRSDKMDANSSTYDASSSEKKDGRKRGRGKASSDKVMTKLSHEDDKGLITAPKSSLKLPKHEDQIDETPIKSSKRKCGSGKEKATDTIDYGDDLVGSKVKVWWPDDKQFYEGIIDSFDPVGKRHKVLYNDGDEETLNLKKERWELIEGGSEAHGEQKSGHQSPDLLSKMHKKKKTKTYSEESAKQETLEATRGAESFSSKMKGVAKKLARKFRDNGKVDGKSSETKYRGKSKEDSGNKSEDPSQRSGKSVDSAPRAARKMKDGDTPKPNTKSKQDNSRTASKETPRASGEVTAKAPSKSKGKTPKSSNKSNANSGSGGKAKSTAKVEETETKEGSPDTTKTLGRGKGKSSDTSKTPGASTKSGKKRRRA